MDDTNVRKAVEEDFREQVANALGIDKSKVVIINMEKGSIKINFMVVVDWANTENTKEDKIEKTLQALNKNNISVKEKMSFAFRLSEQDFDSRGDMFFFTSDVFQRGPRGNTEKYTQPTKEWFRIGLKMNGKYENDNWLKMNNNPEEWYVAYHGVGVGQIMPSVFSNILKTGLIAGAGQVHRNDKCRKTG